MQIKRDTPIEEIVEASSKAVAYLMRNGIHCVVCGEPVWGTLQELARSKGFSDTKIDKFVEELNKLK
ncbi:MAG: DUF1858 domain-containing protein [Candidatus Cloacimonadota bacterium]|nr:DUF1858 domain-containing protein [Candidatus Cloacimonadota bacterium]